MIRTVTIQLFDKDPGLKVEHSLVASFKDVLTNTTDNKTILEIVYKNNFKKILENHNKFRVTQIDLDILNRTGITTMLRPIELYNLTWEVKE